MGIGKKGYLYLLEMMDVSGIDKQEKITLCEFGDLMVRIDMGEIRRQYTRKSVLSGEQLFKYLNIETTSIDLNGLHNSIKMDLRDEITDPNLLNYFDIVLDYGTSEHVISNQYQVFKNANDLCKMSGIMIHALRCSETGHASWYYNEKFFENLCRRAGYHVLDFRITEPAYKWKPSTRLAFITVRKSREEFMAKGDWVDPSGDMIGMKRWGEEIAPRS